MITYILWYFLSPGNFQVNDETLLNWFRKNPINFEWVLWNFSFLAYNNFKCFSWKDKWYDEIEFNVPIVKLNTRRCFSIYVNLNFSHPTQFLFENGKKLRIVNMTIYHVFDVFSGQGVKFVEKLMCPVFSRFQLWRQFTPMSISCQSCRFFDCR